MRRRFFVEQFEGNAAVLRGDAAEHLERVLRAEPGQLYELSDGEKVWLARVEHLRLAKRGESSVEFALIEPVVAREPTLRIELLISIVKFDAFEWCLEKATELGASEIVPLAAARTDRALTEAARKRSARWQKILAESAQQSRRLRPPKLLVPPGGATNTESSGADGKIASPEKAFAQSVATCQVLLSERRGARPLRDVLHGMHPSAGSEATGGVALAIGPEGGWTDKEISAARASGFCEASLGENILRTETAVIAAMAIVGFVFGRE
jgi:16S rRNA (uracil1498-N3)-methyltransferase